VATGIGFVLFVVTSLWGRVWCGYACPQTVFMEGVFRRIERWVEGPRLTRIRRNRGPWTFDRTWRKILKQLIFLLLSYLIAHIFLTYFLPAHELLEVIRSNPKEHMSAFLWTMFWTGILYFNYTWFREQTCLIVCPYGRLQSTLIDSETIIIGYDQSRGEPRMKGVDQGGDCIDCYRCVEVCPTGIDIRNGLQMECIGCANCIDACDEVMVKIDKPPGLVRYDSQRGFDGDRRRFLRPRVWIYLGLGIVGMVAAFFFSSERAAYEAKVVRSRGMPFVIEEGRIRNLYTLHIQNKTTGSAVYFIAPADDITTLPGSLEFIIPQRVVRLAGLASTQTPLFATLPRAEYTGPFDFHFTVTDSLTAQERWVKVRFRGP
jgi:cytochrome c oxidase accessory protein FixG